jgi:DNA-binding response OmpR family regulator
VTTEAPASDIPRAADLEIRPAEGLLLADGRVVMLSVREFRLLVAFARRADAVLSRAELYATVWGGPMRSGDRSVDVYVRKLRVKLAHASPQRRFIHTHQGFGYRFESCLAETPTCAPGPAVNGRAVATPGG